MHPIRFAALVAVSLALGSACADPEGGSTARERQQIAITLSDAGCSPASIDIEAGPVRFYVTNPRSSTVTSFEVLDGTRTVANVTNVLGGISRSQDVDMVAGNYTTRCIQGNAGATGTLVVREVP